MPPGWVWTSTFAEADLLDGEPCDAVLANLPYVSRVLRCPLRSRGSNHAGALFAGADGLDLVRRLVSSLSGPAVGLVALEIGPEQAAEVRRLVRRGGLRRTWTSGATWPACDRVSWGRR